MTSLVAPPINFAAIRSGIAQTLQAALGLPGNQVIQMQMESPPAPRPKLPFVAFMLTGIGQSFGKDALVENETGGFTYTGPRMLSATFQFYGETHEQSYTLATTWHSALDQDHVQDDLLTKSGLSVWSRNPPTDISQMLLTGYEGRASFNCTFGVQALSAASIGNIEQVGVRGYVDADGAVEVTVTKDPP